MWKHLKMLYKRVHTPSHLMNYESLDNRLQNALATQIFHTPKLQKMMFTE